MPIKLTSTDNLKNGLQVKTFTLTNSGGMEAVVCEYGASILKVMVPDREGTKADVVLGFKDLNDYIVGVGHLGKTVGRNCGRILPSKVNIGGKEYPLEKNNGEANLHGGSGGMGHRKFNGEIVTENGEEKLVMSVLVPSLSDDFPGDLEATVSFSLNEEGELKLEYFAVSNEETVISLTNHSYFNLGGHGSGVVDDHILELAAPLYTNQNAQLLTESIEKVEGTPFDFTTPKRLGDALSSEHSQIRLNNGIDNSFVLSGNGYRRVAVLSEPKSGRIMETFTTETCIQVYTANMLKVVGIGKDGVDYGSHCGICLETQTIPNSVNLPWGKVPIYKAGEEYHQATVYKFSVN